MLGILLIVVGAILTFALNAGAHGINLNTVGVILMIAGALTLLIGLFREAAWADRWRRGDRVVERDRVVEPERVVERDPRL